MKTLDNKSVKNPSENFYPGYLTYTPDEDIYVQNIETNLDPEDVSKEKEINNDNGKWNEKDFDDNHSGDDLDVPGSELDDDQEEIGSEDEENNYYSTGGDAHNNLDENDDKY